METSALHPLPHERAASRAWLAPLALLAIFFAAVLPAILTGYHAGRAYADHADFHLPAIRFFQAQGMQFADYPSATTPGYHVLLAQLGGVVGDSETTLQLLNAVIGALFVAMLARILSRRFDLRDTVLLMLPAMASLYFLPASIWLLPDNLSWLLVAASLLLVLDGACSAGWVVMVGGTIALAVLVRQTNLWLVPVAWLAVWLDNVTLRTTRARLAAMAGLAAVPCLIVLYFVLLWRGLVPPTFAERHHALNPAVPVYFFFLLWIYGLPFIPLLYRRLRRSAADAGLPRLAGFLACALLIAALPATSMDPAHGRESGLWALANAGPVIHDRSLVIMTGAALGMMLFAGLLSIVDRRGCILLAGAVAAFVLANTLNHYAYERYYAVFVYLALWLFLYRADLRQRIPKLGVALLAGATLANAAVMIAKLR